MRRAYLGILFVGGLFLVAQACGDDDNGTSPTVTTGSGTVTGGVGGAGGATSCTDKGEDCETCLASACGQAACAAEVQACLDTPDCAGFEACQDECTKDPPNYATCQAQCFVDYPEGLEALSEKYDCLFCKPEACAEFCSQGIACGDGGAGGGGPIGPGGGPPAGAGGGPPAGAGGGPPAGSGGAPPTGPGGGPPAGQGGSGGAGGPGGAGGAGGS